MSIVVDFFVNTLSIQLTTLLNKKQRVGLFDREEKKMEHGSVEQ